MSLSQARYDLLDTTGIRRTVTTRTSVGPVVKEYIIGRLSVRIPVYDPSRWFDWPCFFDVSPIPCEFVLGLAGVTDDIRISIDTALTSPVAPCGMLILE